jgi:aminoglycoside phosphotransferase (APT) family kinase protein
MGAPVQGLTRLSAGASRETWAFDCDGRPLICQREPAGGVAVGRGMAIESRLLGVAFAAGVAVPAVVRTGDSAAGLGRPFLITERLDGETIPRKLLRDDEYATVRPSLAARAGAELAAVHSMPVEPVEDVLEEGDPVAQFGELLTLFDEPHPAFELALRWLARHRPEPAGRTIVHGDFRTGNLLVTPDGISALLDWELAHIGDPAEDLGWFCVRAWRFGSPHRAGGFGSVEQLLEGYRSAGGRDISPETVRWWEVMGTLRWGVICLIQAGSHLSGVSRSVELATIGRRAAETEWDLLELMAPGAPSTDPAVADPVVPEPAVPQLASTAPTQTGAPHDRPTAAELVDAVRELLIDELLDAVDGRLRFQVRVAANALAMVGRELALGTAQAAAHTDRLAALGVADDAELATAIRSGDIDARWDEVASALRAAVLDKLAVSNPTYATDDR